MCMFTLLVSQSLHDTKAILTAFFNVNLNHMLLHSEFHVFISLAWKSLNLQYCYTLFIILCQHLFDNLDTFFCFMAESVRFELTEPCGSAVFKTAGINHSPSSPYWLQGKDLNLRPSAYEADKLPNCSTLRQIDITFNGGNPLNATVLYVLV